MSIRNGTRVRIIKSPSSYDIDQTGTVVPDDRPPYRDYVFSVRVKLDHPEEIAARFPYKTVEDCTYSYCTPSQLETIQIKH